MPSLGLVLFSWVTPRSWPVQVWLSWTNVPHSSFQLSWGWLGSAGDHQGVGQGPWALCLLRGLLVQQFTGCQLLLKGVQHFKQMGFALGKQIASMSI